MKKDSIGNTIDKTGGADTVSYTHLQFYQGGDVVPVNTVMGYVGEAGQAVPEQDAKACLLYTSKEDFTETEGES